MPYQWGSFFNTFNPFCYFTPFDSCTLLVRITSMHIMCMPCFCRFGSNVVNPLFGSTINLNAYEMNVFNWTIQYHMKSFSQFIIYHLCKHSLNHIANQMKLYKIITGILSIGFTTNIPISQLWFLMWVSFPKWSYKHKSSELATKSHKPLLPFRKLAT